MGINPGLWTAATGAHFARPGNRFFPALAAAGIIERPIDASSGLSTRDRDHLFRRGIGITNLVGRATAKADELTAEGLVAGAHRVRETVRAHSSYAAVAEAADIVLQRGPRGNLDGRSGGASH